MKTSMKKLTVVTAAAALAAGMMAGSAMAEDMQDASMVFCTWTGYAPMFIAKELGYFEEAGINMDIQIVEDESTYASLITNGSVQFLATAQDPNIKMFANGARSQYMLTMDESMGADGLVASADIETLDDLAGKSLALDKSASSYYFFLKALEGGSSLTEEDINVIDMGDTTEAGVAFIGGRVDAAIMWEPELSDALDEVEGAHAIVTTADYPDTVSDSLVVNAAYAEEHPEVVAAVEEAWYKAVDFLKENPEEAYGYMASGFEEVTEEDIESDCKGLTFLGREENEALEDESAEKNIYTICADMAAFWLEKGECETDDLTGYFDLIG